MSVRSGRQKKTIYLYVRTRGESSFLNVFFSKRKEFEYEFFSNFRLLKSRLKDGKPAVIITDAPRGIRQVQKLASGIPVIALISSKIQLGVRTSIKYDANCHLISPFFESELEAKLKVAVSGKHWFKKLYQEKKDVEAIMELSSLISSTLDPKEILYLVVRNLSKMIDVTRCSIIGMGFQEKRSAFVVTSNDNPSLSGIKLDLKRYPEIRKVISTKRPVIITDAMRDDIMRPVRKLIEPVGIKSLILVPIIFKDEMIGTLILTTARARKIFTDREIRFCTAIANISANSLYNAFLFEQMETEKNHLEDLSITDYLTGVFNIRYLYYRLEEEFSRAHRYNTTLGCIMMDIDLFKKINDTYGHRAGDVVLREFAQLIKMNTRKSDIFARYGGEEFILVMPQTTTTGSMKEAKRLLNAVREHQFSELGKNRITMSIGIAHIPDMRVKRYEDLITLADDALFQAKKQGRNMVVINHQELDRKSAMETAYSDRYM